MLDSAQALARVLIDADLPVFAADRGATQSHQFALEAKRWGGGQAASRLLRRAGLLASGIGLPLGELDADVNGLRLGTPEIVRWGMAPGDMPTLGGLLTAALSGHRSATEVAMDVAAMRARFNRLHFVGDSA
jgi:glycine hydroxymethyltransferase